MQHSYIGKVILGVTESDAHVVANRLIADLLRRAGYDTINLGACTPVSEFIQCASENSDTDAILIGSMNGHALNDLRTLAKERRRAGVVCPIILGGNLSVGSQKPADYHTRLLACGVDLILDSHLEILPTLARLERRTRQKLPAHLLQMTA